MKQIAILEYSIMFDPSIAWSNGYQFENQLADFFAANGFEANIVEAKGGTGRRVIFLTPLEFTDLQVKDPSKKATEQIKQIAQKPTPKDFKRFKEPRHSNIIPPKLNYEVGRTNRMKVRNP